MQKRFAIIVIIVALLAACEDGEDACRPTCDGYCARDDGCGGVCACPSNLVCAPDQTCRLLDLCRETCASVGHLCGEICGAFCGDCAEGLRCVGGDCACEPQCDGSHCRGDGCGGACACAGGEVCSAQGTCLAASTCADACADSLAQCGEVCGEVCGTCDAHEACTASYACACRPECDGSHCGSDGCGGQCPSPCGTEARSPSCSDCAVRLELVTQSVSDGSLTGATLRITYAPTATEPRARAMDLVLAANQPFALVAAEPGPALAAAGKALWTNPATGRAWRVLPEGRVQLLVLASGDGETRLEGGEIAALSILVPRLPSVALALTRREQTLAPAEADHALQASDYDSSLVLSASP